MTRTTTVAAVVLALAGSVQGAMAQESSVAVEAYLRGVAEFFDVARSEVAILGDWQLPTEEIPVVLFVARRAGVSPEALATLRRSGRGWSDLARRYQLGGAQFHVPLRDEAQAGVLSGAYRQYRSVPPARWVEVQLSDADIVALVNVRVLAQQLRLSAEEVLSGYRGSYVELYARLIRDG